ncbi:MAG: HK97 family phage prohead protease [Acetobacteraceae bacterium]
MDRFPNGTELRSGVELRAAAGRRLEGYAAVFGSEARIGGFAETIRPGAFQAVLASGKDVLALVDHDPARLLGRTGSGTLRLSEDARGLAFSLDLPDTQLGRDILALAERRDLGGMSFSFRAIDEAWPTSTRRELRAVDLLEISVVQAFPAYDQTTVSARARQLGRHAADVRLRRLILSTI